MDQEKFKNAVKQMRFWQKMYFRTKSPSAMQDAKRLEKEVDQMLEDDAQPQLF